MSETWDYLARSLGRRSVMSPVIDDAGLDAETERQIPILLAMLRDQLDGTERVALDYGAGYGRFSDTLATAIGGRVMAFDPCAALVESAQGSVRVDFVSTSPEAFFAETRANGTLFDVVFAAQVLGDPALDLEQTVADLVSVLAPGGLMAVMDHMPVTIPRGRWWRFRPADDYRNAFAAHDITMTWVGDMKQLEETVSMLAGRRPA